ncbi:MAG: hypothetical protein JXR86_13665 [Spirochaetales bacterium]|nr:hypothetical protein [Spirochaetales bacterium]
MKKVLLMTIALILTSGMLFADGKRVESRSLSGQPAVGKLKMGVVVGTDNAYTLGIRTSDSFEINGVLGYGLNSRAAGFLVGANALFTIADININGQIFPLSVGPAVNAIFGVGYNPTNIYTYTSLNSLFGVDIEALALVRWEYSFQQIPINLFVEAGAGLSFGSFGFGFGFQSNFGARWIF